MSVPRVALYHRFDPNTEVVLYKVAGPGVMRVGDSGGFGMERTRTDEHRSVVFSPVFEVGGYYIVAGWSGVAPSRCGHAAARSRRCHPTASEIGLPVADPAGPRQPDRTDRLATSGGRGESVVQRSDTQTGTATPIA